MFLALLVTSVLAQDRDALDRLGDTYDDDRLVEAADEGRLRWTYDRKGQPKPIIHGEDAFVEDFPSAGGLVAEGSIGALSGKLFMCSSTLIAPDVVLTAAHCVDFEDLVRQQYGVTLDSLDFYWSRETDLSGYGLGASLPLPDDAAKGSQFTWHDDWVGATALQIGLSENNDIGLIFLDEPLEDVPLAILPTPEEALLLQEGDLVDIVGWGQRSQTEVGGQGPAGEKQFADSWIAELGEFEFKVGEDPEDARKCHGDSGGPTYWELAETDTLDPRRQIGVTSHSYDYTDCTQTGGVDTRVDPYLDWLDELLRDACLDGTRSWCPRDDRGDPVPESWGVLQPPTLQSERGGACGCQSSPSPIGTLAWALPLLIVLRRRS